MSQITKGKYHIPNSGKPIPTESRDLHVPNKSRNNKILYLFFFNYTKLIGDCLLPPELSAHISFPYLSAGLRMSLHRLLVELFSPRRSSMTVPRNCFLYLSQVWRQTFSQILYKQKSLNCLFFPS